MLLGGALHLAKTIERKTDRPHVGVMLPTSGAFPLAVLASWLAGRVPVPVNYLLGRDDLHHVFADAEVDVVLTAGKMLEHVRENTAPDAVPDSIQTLCLEEQNFKGIPPLRWPPAPNDDDLGVLLYTSGTSGRPKGVELTHGNLDANARDAIAHAGLTRGLSFVGVLPQFHTFGLTVLTLIPLLIGAKAVYTARFVPRRLVQLIKEHQASVMVAVPSMYNAILGVRSAEAADLASLKLTVAGGEKLPTALRENFRERFGIEILEGYGLTETAPVTNWATPDDPRPGSVGRSLPRVRNVILDEDLRPLATGEDGEIGIAGPNVMRGYHHLPELTDEVIRHVPLDPDRPDATTRVFRTGDIGHLDEDGFLYITGRKKEMLIISGENVFPREIEEVLDRHPEVHASAVIGQPDESRGEVPVAYVELCPELPEGHTLDEGAVKAFCREQMAPFKVPRAIHVLDALPRNPTGKIMRRALVERAATTPQT